MQILLLFLLHKGFRPLPGFPIRFYDGSIGIHRDRDRGRQDFLDQFGDPQEGNLSLEECRRLWLHNTRAYAKRQRTWFRSPRSCPS